MSRPNLGRFCLPLALTFGNKTKRRHNILGVAPAYHWVAIALYIKTKGEHTPKGEVEKNILYVTPHFSKKKPPVKR
jgi:hypothetical protein